MFYSTISTLALLLSFAAASPATRTVDETAANADNESLREMLLVLDQQFWHSSSKQDIETLGRLIADDYVGLGADGIRWTKTELLRQLGETRAVGLRRTSEPEVIRLNAQAAVLTYEAFFRTVSGNDQVSAPAHQRMMACWVERDGNWFVVFSQVGNTPPPQLDESQVLR